MNSVWHILWICIISSRSLPDYTHIQYGRCCWRSRPYLFCQSNWYHSRFLGESSYCFCLIFFFSMIIVSPIFSFYVYFIRFATLCKWIVLCSCVHVDDMFFFGFGVFDHSTIRYLFLPIFYENVLHESVLFRQVYGI